MSALAVILAGILLAGAACSDDGGDDDAGEDTSSEETTTTAEAEEAEAEEVEWGYEGDVGPERWAELSAEYELCGSGTEQSPIDLTSAAEEDLPDLGFAYEATPLAIYDNGHTVEVEAEPGTSTLDLAGVTYELVQLHFHVGSEHTVDGEQHAAEVHLVHSTDDGELAVVGLLVDEGEANEVLAPVFDNLPTEVTEEPVEVEDQTVDLAALLPDDQTYFQYAGSLTTPPCSEDVSWQVLTTPIEVSADQLDGLAELIEGNFRPTQPLGERDLAEDVG